MSESGYTQQDIATILSVSQCGISKFLKRYKTCGSSENKHRSGRPRKTYVRRDRKILRYVRQQTSCEITDEVNLKLPNSISSRTLRRRLRFLKLGRRITRKTLTIRSVNRTRRVNWCRGKLHWTVNNNLEKVILAMKPRFLLTRISEFTYGQDGTKNCDPWLSVRGNGKYSAMFWGCVTYEGIETFTEVDGNIYSQKYINILDVQNRHVDCVQDPPGLQFYTQVNTLKKGNIVLSVYRCARGSTSLESFHLHMNRFIPEGECCLGGVFGKWVIIKMSGGNIKNQLREELSSRCVIVGGFPPTTLPQNVYRLFQCQRAEPAGDGTTWLVLFQNEEAAKLCVTKGSLYRIGNLILRASSSSGSDIPDAWLQDDQHNQNGSATDQMYGFPTTFPVYPRYPGYPSHSYPLSTPFNSYNQHFPKSSPFVYPSEGPTITSPVGFQHTLSSESEPQVTTADTKSSKSSMAATVYQNYPIMPMSEPGAMVPQPYERHNFPPKLPSNPSTMKSPQRKQEQSSFLRGPDIESGKTSVKDTCTKSSKSSMAATVYQNYPIMPMSEPGAMVPQPYERHNFPPKLPSNPSTMKSPQRKQEQPSILQGPDIESGKTSVKDTCTKSSKSSMAATVYQNYPIMPMSEPGAMVPQPYERHNFPPKLPSNPSTMKSPQRKQEQPSILQGPDIESGKTSVKDEYTNPKIENETLENNPEKLEGQDIYVPPFVIPALTSSEETTMAQVAVFSTENRGLNESTEAQAAVFPSEKFQSEGMTRNAYSS